jgi:hypothetical protein
MAFERTEVFYWLLNHLGQFLQDKLLTIFTDEDLAMMAAIEMIKAQHPNVHHRLCVWHKRSNFQKWVQSATHDSKVVVAALELFDSIVSEKSPGKNDQPRDRLLTLIPNLTAYIDIEVHDMRTHLTEAYRGNGFGLGRGSTQAGESSNASLRKLLARSLRTLMQIREAYTQAHTILAGAVAAAIARRSHGVHFTESRFGLKLHRPICH